MHKIWLFVLLLVAACTAQNAPTATVNPTAVQRAVQATLSAQALTPPRLVSPRDGATFDSPRVRLEWEWVRPLYGAEIFDVRIWREGRPHYGITWENGTSLDITQWLSQQEPGTFFWSVAVILGGERGTGEVLGTVSEEGAARSFTVTKTSLPTPTPSPTPAEEVTGDLAVPLVAPPGFEIHPYTDSLNTSFITEMFFRPDGRLYILTLEGDIFALNDEDGDHFAESMEPILRDTENRLNWVTGMAFYDDKLYISDSGRISTLYDEDGDGYPDWSTFATIVEGLPSAPFMVHSNNSIVFYEDKLYVPVGSITDHGPIEAELEGSILRMNPDGSDIEVIAAGFRNPYEIAIAPNGDMFTGDNSPDTMDKTMAYLPPEEINHIREGRHYGFPDYYGNAVPEGVEKPVVELFTSSATTGMVYYAADHFPEAYRNGIYVAQYGTANGNALSLGVRNGYAIAFVSLTPTDDGTYTGDWEPFVQAATPGGWFRPTDVTVGPDGALYTAETTRGIMIQRVTYVGEEAAQASTPSETPTDANNPAATITPEVLENQ